MKKLSHLTKKENKALQELKQELYKKLPNQIEFIRLYGSKARGDAGKYSDIDLLVVTQQEDEKIRDEITNIEIKNIEKYGLPLSSIIMSNKQYKWHLNIPTLFIQFVQKEGIIL